MARNKTLKTTIKIYFHKSTSINSEFRKDWHGAKTVTQEVLGL